MNRLKAITVLFTIFLLASCVGVHTEYSDDTGLVLETSTTSINIDEGESVSFTVYYNGEDVTNDAKIVYCIEEESGDVITQPFIPATPGVYRFIAQFGYKTSESVSVTAFKTSIENKRFYKRVNIMEFTGSWCTYCPNMAVAVETVMKKMPDRMVVTALHASDIYSIAEATVLQKYFNVVGFPTVIVDCRPDLQIGTSSPTLIQNAVEKAILYYPDACGIAINSSCKDGILNVEVKVNFVKDNEYKIVVELLEDGIVGSQSGVGGDYVHSNTLRQYLTDPIGDDLGEREKNEEFQKTFTAAFDDTKWAVNNCRVVVYVLDKQPESKYYSNNICTIGVNGSVGYKYELNVQ